MLRFQAPHLREHLTWWHCATAGGDPGSTIVMALDGAHASFNRCTHRCGVSLMRSRGCPGVMHEPFLFRLRSNVAILFTCELRRHVRGAGLDQSP